MALLKKKIQPKAPSTVKLEQKLKRYIKKVPRRSRNEPNEPGKFPHQEIQKTTDPKNRNRNPANHSPCNGLNLLIVDFEIYNLSVFLQRHQLLYRRRTKNYLPPHLHQQHTIKSHFKFQQLLHKSPSNILPS